MVMHMPNHIHMR